MNASVKALIIGGALVVAFAWWARFETVETQRAGFYLVNRWTGEVFLYNAAAYQRVEPRVEKKPLTFDDIPSRDDSWYKNSPPVEPKPVGL